MGAVEQLCKDKHWKRDKKHVLGEEAGRTGEVGRHHVNRACFARGKMPNLTGIRSIIMFEAISVAQKAASSPTNRPTL